MHIILRVGLIKENTSSDHYSNFVAVSPDTAYSGLKLCSDRQRQQALMTLKYTKGEKENIRECSNSLPTPCQLVGGLIQFVIIMCIYSMWHNLLHAEQKAAPLCSTKKPSTSPCIIWHLKGQLPLPWVKNMECWLTWLSLHNHQTESTLNTFTIYANITGKLQQHHNLLWCRNVGLW